MSSRLMEGIKKPSQEGEPGGVQPMGCGEIIRRTAVKLVIMVMGLEARVACGNKQLCAGLSCGVEGVVHALSLAVSTTW